MCHLLTSEDLGRSLRFLNFSVCVGGYPQEGQHWAAASLEPGGDTGSLGRGEIQGQTAAKGF